MTTLRLRANPLAAAPADATSQARQPNWARWGLLVLLAGTAGLYLWDLGASGYANTFYAAAVQAGTKNWTAWLFGSLDSSNSITVDKPPAALWVMGLSGRIFGFNAWSLLVPQALEGVAAVGILYAAVKRWSGPAAGLVAGTMLALTPVAALMFRFDNPDALLTLLLVVAAYCTVRAAEKAGPGWLMLAGTALGFGFLTKMLQAFLVLPAIAVVYLVAAPTGLGRRLWHLLLGGVAVLVSAGWFVLLAELWPASARPYIGGSTNNSLLQLALGYNGLARVFGGEGNAGGGGGGMGGNTGFGGATGLFRLFGSSFGTEISWLLPAALIALVAGLWFTRWQPRTDRTRAALLLWGGWLLVTGVVFSFMQGTVHPYYAVALAPAIGALVAIGGRELWRGRDFAPARYVLGSMVAVTGVWNFILLDRDSGWLPAIRWVVLVASVLVATAIVVGVHQFGRRLAAVLLVATLLTGLAGTSAWAVATAASPHSGSIPTSGPSSAGADGGPGGFGGRLSGDTGSSALAALLANTTTTWAAAVSGSQSAAELELATGKAVMAIGGFSGSDPSPTLAQFEQWVWAGKIHYYLSGGGMGGGMGRDSGTGSQIATWVAANFTSTTVGGQTVYDLTKSK